MRILKATTKAFDQLPPSPLHLVRWKLLRAFKGFHYVPCTISLGLPLYLDFKKKGNTETSYLTLSYHIRQCYTYRALEVAPMEDALLAMTAYFACFCLLVIHYIGELAGPEEQQHYSHTVKNAIMETRLQFLRYMTDFALSISVHSSVLYTSNV